jgi:drug/metabolite transporter (DMT)-like permease
MTDHALAASVLDRPSGSAYRRGALCVLITTLLWSTGGIVVRSVETASAWHILLYRSLGLIPALFVIIAIGSRGRILAAFRSAGWPGVLGGLALVASSTGAIVSMKETTIANATLIWGSSPFWTALLAWILLGERVRRATLLVLPVAAIGMAIMVSGDLGSGRLSGNLWALLCAVGFGFFNVALRWRQGVDMTPAVFTSGVLTVLLALGVIAGMGSPLAVPMGDFALAFSLGIFQIGLGLYFYTQGAKHLPAVDLALLTLLEALFAPTWVYLLFNETVGLPTLIGGAILMGAIVVNAVSGIRRKLPPVSP